MCSAVFTTTPQVAEQFRVDLVHCHSPRNTELQGISDTAVVPWLIMSSRRAFVIARRVPEADQAGAGSRWRPAMWRAARIDCRGVGRLARIARSAA